MSFLGRQCSASQPVEMTKLAQIGQVSAAPFTTYTSSLEDCNFDLHPEWSSAMLLSFSVTCSWGSHVEVHPVVANFALGDEGSRLVFIAMGSTLTSQRCWVDVFHGFLKSMWTEFKCCHEASADSSGIMTAHSNACWCVELLLKLYSQHVTRMVRACHTKMLI